MKRIGISLPPRVLTCEDTQSVGRINADFGSIGAFLGALKAAGVGSIELRAVKPDFSPEYVGALARAVQGARLGLTVHAVMSGDGKKEAVLTPLARILGECGDDILTVTVHALTDDCGNLSNAAERTVRSLYGICDFCEKEGFPVEICLELNRKKSEEDPSVTCESVVDMVRRVGNERLGICWDFGHYWYNRVLSGDLDTIPPEEFLRLVRHTHIHGVHKNVTHYPLIQEDMPKLGAYINALNKAGYRGIYNIELTLRYLIEGNYSLKEAYLGSVGVLTEGISERF